MPSITRIISLPNIFNNYCIIYPSDPGTSLQVQPPSNTNQYSSQSSKSEETKSVSKPPMNYQTEHTPRPVKIESVDKELYFDGINIPVKTFIRRYEASGKIDGASAKDLFEQI